MARSAVLITGAARRLGRATALYLAERGFDIALHYHTSETDAHTTAEDIRKHGVTCTLFQADLAQSAALPGLVEAVFQAFPHCAHLVNNASVFERAPFLESNAALYAHTFAVNVAAPIYLTQAFAARGLIETCVVNMLDAKDTATRHSYFYYLLSKKTLRDFTLMAAAELAGKTRVNGASISRALPNADGHHAHLPTDTTPEAVAEAVYRLITTPGVSGEVVGG